MTYIVNDNCINCNTHCRSLPVDCFYGRNRSSSIPIVIDCGVCEPEYA